MVTARDIVTLLPILITALGGIWVLLIVSLLRGKDVRWPAAHAVILLGLSAAVSTMLLSRGGDHHLLSGAILIDRQALVFHLIFVTVAILTILSSVHLLEKVGAPHGEFYALLLFAVSGMTMMASSENLLTIFMGLEVLSICLYVLAGFTRDQVYSIEGALKYFLLGAFSTGFVLYGIALLYGVTGRIDLPGIASRLVMSEGEPIDPLAFIGVALLLIGFSFKIAAVPFHFWAPDVYQGAMAPVSGFMATGTKAAAFAALVRIVEVGMSEAAIRERWIVLISAIAVVTMIVGNLVALTQQNIKRMLAYSSIANAGYLLVAVAAGGRTGGGTSVVLFYLVTYAFMTVGAFSVVALVGRSSEGDQGSAISSFAGLGRRRPGLAFAMTVFMLSLTGIPPSGGFIGKFYIFRSAIDAGMYPVAIIGLLASVVSAFYYLSVVVQMYFREPVTGAAPVTPLPAEALAILIAAVATLWIGLFPSGILQLTGNLI